MQMSLVKTEKGKDALQTRDPALSARDRQIVVLSNGERSVSTFIALMGAAVEQDIQRLMANGYLQESGLTQGRPNTFGDAAPAPAAPMVDAVISPEAKPCLPAPPVAAPKITSRRSLAATKMYIVDMLQLMRDMDASAMAVSVHTSANEDEFLAHLLASARLISQKSGVSYRERVISKLCEIAPEPFVPHLERLEADLDMMNS